MKLYHFTAKHLLTRINAEGLTLGGVPLLKEKELKFFTNCQWLTLRDGWDQVFHDPEYTKLKYDRREVRLKIVIPESRRKSLFDIKRIENVFGTHLLPDFFADPDCINWYIFYGRVKAQWIREVTFNPRLEENDKK